MKHIKSILVFACACALLLFSSSLTAQHNTRKSPEYVLELNLFIEDYDAALFIITAMDDSASIEEVMEIQESYELLMEQSRVHFRKLLDLTEEGEEKEIMKLMYEQLKTQN